MDERRCCFCDRPKESGLHICGELICPECEEALVKVTANDTQYDYYREAMKRLLSKCFTQQEPG